MGLTERATRTDGRLLPIAGDTVYMTTRGPFGSAASVSGTVYESRGKVGGLRVKITGASSFFGVGYRGPKTVVLDERWTVVNDPAIERAREAAAREREEAAARREREEAEYEASVNASVDEALARGESIVDFDAAVVGLVVFDHRTGTAGVIEEIATNVADGPWLFVRHDGDDWAGSVGGRDFARLTTTGAMAPVGEAAA